MLWIIAVAALCLLVCLPFFMYYKHTLRLHLAASYKTLGTLCAAVLALTAALRLNPHCWICFAALLLHAAADWFLEFNLYLGAGLFIAGHICYISLFKKAYYGLKPGQWGFAMGSMIIFVVVLVLIIGIKGAMLAPMCIYGSALAFLIFCGVAGVLRKLGPAWTFILIGAVLFTFSDANIAMDTFGKSYPGQPFVIMLTYLAAQALLAIGSIKLIKADD